MPAYFVGYSSPQVLPVACGTKMFTLLGGFVVLCVYEYIQTYIHTLKKYSVINGAQWWADEEQAKQFKYCSEDEH